MADRDDATAARLNATYHIGEVARRTHLSLRTLRYWDEVGLVSPSSRSHGGFRRYSNDDVARVMLVRHMKATDLTIEELLDLVSLVDRLRAPGAAPDRTTDTARLLAFVSRIRARCEVLKGRIAEAEGAALELEALADGIDLD